MGKNLISTLKGALSIFLVSAMIGCGTYGKIKRDNDAVTPYFESGTIVQGEEYRQTPCGSNPTAIINFPEGSLDSKLWSCPILNSEELKTKTSKIKENASQDETGVGGAYILDNKGNMIGQVYAGDSYLKSNPTVWIKDNNKFTIKTPGMMSSGGKSVSPPSGGKGRRGGSK